MAVHINDYPRKMGNDMADAAGMKAYVPKPKKPKKIKSTKSTKMKKPKMGAM